MPVRIDRSAPMRGVPPGTYLLQVRECEEQESKKSENMLHVTFVVAQGPCRGEEIEAYFMLEGKGRGIGHAQLGALGIDIAQDFEASDLIGKRAWAAMTTQERVYQGKRYTNSRIDARAKGSHCGLWPESKPPASADPADLADAKSDGSDPLANVGSADDVPF